jgi:hypothetical protein
MLLTMGNFDTNYIICRKFEIFIKKNSIFFLGVNENREYFEYSGFDMKSSKIINYSTKMC